MRILIDIRIDGMVGANYMNRTYRFMNVQANDITVPNLFTIGNVSGSPIATCIILKLSATACSVCEHFIPEFPVY
jgi:hypothetical protein